MAGGIAWNFSSSSSARDERPYDVREPGTGVVIRRVIWAFDSLTVTISRHVSPTEAHYFKGALGDSATVIYFTPHLHSGEVMRTGDWECTADALSTTEGTHLLWTQSWTIHETPKIIRTEEINPNEQGPA